MSVKFLNNYDYFAILIGGGILKSLLFFFNCNLSMSTTRRLVLDLSQYGEHVLIQDADSGETILKLKKEKVIEQLLMLSTDIVQPKTGKLELNIDGHFFFIPIYDKDSGKIAPKVFDHTPNKYLISVFSQVLFLSLLIWDLPTLPLVLVIYLRVLSTVL